MSRPTVSVMMPCYNARQSLPWALGSLLVQTFEDWELVLVDDGSTDHPEEVTEQAVDPRIRLIRLPENRGRGHARQVALDNARGEFIAMLDADDWMYPDRLKREILSLRAQPSMALVSAAMAIVDRGNELVGVRGGGAGNVLGPYRGLNSPVVHAASMIRREAIGSARFDPSLKLGQDQDFLVRVLQEHTYLVLPDPLYAYAEIESVSARKAAVGQRYLRKRLLKHIRSHPRQVVRGLVVSSVKELAYTAGAILGLERQMIQRRSNPPTDLERRAFADARRKVEQVVWNRFSVD